MVAKEFITITVKTFINKPVADVWKYWTTPEDIVKWNYASDDWHTTMAENDLQVGGRFISRMEAKDGSSGFDFSGVYQKVDIYRHIEYIMDDGRTVKVTFIETENKTEIIESFEAENENSIEMQHDGWQSILDNFKKYTEGF